MTYEEALNYLQGLIRFGIKLDLDRFRMLCTRLGDPQDRFKSIHIGGTNGKGSTTAMIASILHSAGYKVGTYLSPYVHDVRERIQIDGEMIGKGDFADLMERITPHLEAVAATEAGQPTEFEAKTLMAFLYFAGGDASARSLEPKLLSRKPVDFACLEVGMGGRFDATNIVNPVVSVITNVSLDHQERLGDTVEKIAFEKAGIIKPATPVVTAVEGRAWDVIQSAAMERGSPTVRVAPRAPSLPADVFWEADEQGQLSVFTDLRFYENLQLGLRGEFQYPNAACALAAIEEVEKAGLPVGEEAIREGLAEAYIPGRLEVLRENPTLVIDGAHNPAAAAQLAQAIRSQFKYRRIILVVGMLSTHDPESFLQELAPVAERIIVTAPDWPLARPAEELATAAKPWHSEVSVVEPVQAAVETALAEAGNDDLVLVTGSFYTIGEISAY